MTKFKRKYCEYMADALGLFLTNKPSVELVYRWLWVGDDAVYESDVDLQIFVIDNTKDEFRWTSGIGLIDACRTIVEEAISNGNILTTQKYGYQRYSGKSGECDCQDYENGW